MKLHALDRKFLVAQSHDGLRAARFGRPRADFEFGGQVLFLNNQRVVAGGGERGLQIPEDGPIVMGDGAGFAVHQVGGADDLASEGCSESLVAEADTQNRQLPGEMAKKVNADAGFLRRAGAGRGAEAIGVHGLDFADRDLVVAADHYVGPQFAQILHQVVREGVVVVEDEDHVASGYQKWRGWWRRRRKAGSSAAAPLRNDIGLFGGWARRRGGDLPGGGGT